MQAIAMTSVGTPDVLQLTNLPTPSPGPNQLLVRVHAAAVNPIDYKVRSTGHLGAGPGTVLGFDAAGTVESVGPGVSDFQPGDRVFYSPDAFPGTYAQFNLVSATIVAPMPANLTFDQAAALPLSGMTAYDALFTRGNLSLGQTALIAAANGGVGSLALQMAKAAGAYVFATASTRSADFVRNIPTAGPDPHPPGPDRLLNYQTENWSDLIRQECPQGLDLVFDCAGQDVVSRCLPLMKSMGRIVTIVPPTGNLAEGYRKNVTLHYEFLQRRRTTLEALKTLAERRLLIPLIDSTLPLAQAAEAHRKLESGGVKGKTILHP